jgi:hypothetical protein
MDRRQWEMDDANGFPRQQVISQLNSVGSGSERMQCMQAVFSSRKISQHYSIFVCL